jgi:hypothetical protein
VFHVKQGLSMKCLSLAEFSADLVSLGGIRRATFGVCRSALKMQQMFAQGPKAHGFPFPKNSADGFT